MDTQGLPNLAYVVVVSLIRTKTSYRRLHVTYFIVFTLLGALSIWLAPKPAGMPHFSFIDALYNSVSAMTVTGIASVEMHRFATWDLITLIILMMLGSQVFTSAIPLFLRRYAHRAAPGSLAAAIRRANSGLGESKLPAGSLHGQQSYGIGDLNREQSFGNIELKQLQGNLDRGRSVDIFTGYEELDLIKENHDPDFLQPGSTWLPVMKQKPEVCVRRGISMPVLPSTAKSFSERMTAVLEESRRLRNGTGTTLQKMRSTISESMKIIAKQPSQVNVLLDAKEEEDRLKKEEGALRLLSWLVVGYWLAVQFLGFVIMEACVVASRHATSLLSQRHVNRTFFSFFISVSSFANAGYVPLDDNLVSLNKNEPLLIWTIVLILIGNTMYAPMLRLLTWTALKLSPATWKQTRESLQYLLTRPRSCFTHIFPRTETMWLLITAAVFNGVQVAVICGLDWREGGAFDGLSTGQKLVASVFSSVTTRSAGLNVVNTAAFSAASLVLAVAMMYASVYPVYLSRLRSKEPTIQEDGSFTNPKGEIYVQCRALFARDSVYLFIAIFLVCITERHSIQEDPLNFSIFNIIFEIISGFGNVGLSLGYSCSLRLTDKSTCIDVPYSFSGKWSVVGKLIIVVVMMLGRHRALPEDMDWAIAPPLYE